MSADRLQQSLRLLHGTADALEAQAAAPRLSLVETSQAIATLRPASATSRPRSLARIVTATLAQTAATVAMLALACGVGDPLLPRPSAPSLAAAVEVEANVDSSARAIPQISPKRP